uniref:Secreted protein n=1 Tax=Aliivibrio phage vB_Alvi_H905 TaxID=3234039 RepID=A0AB39C9W2_9VIRU
MESPPFDGQSLLLLLWLCCKTYRSACIEGRFDKGEIWRPPVSWPTSPDPTIARTALSRLTFIATRLHLTARHDQRRDKVQATNPKPTEAKAR